MLPLLVGSAFLTWPSLALGFKRLHDRDRTGWWVAIPTAIGIVLMMLQYTGRGGTVDEVSSLARSNARTPRRNGR